MKHEWHVMKTGIGSGGYLVCPLCGKNTYSSFDGVTEDSECEARAEEQAQYDELRRLVFANVKDLVAKLMYYDRKGDEDLTYNKMKKAVVENIVTADQITGVFDTELKTQIKSNYDPKRL